MKAKIIGYYIKPTWKRPTKGVVFDKRFLSPCMTAGMGGGGNLVPTITEKYETSERSVPAKGQEGQDCET